MSLQEAVTAIKDGDKQTGKKLLTEVLRADPRSEAAWLWMTRAVNTSEERIKCFEQVLSINPDNEKAKQGLAKLQKPIEPEEETPATPTPQKPLTKECPYCAETIKAEAKVCRFCGRELTTGQTPQSQPPVQYIQVFNEKNPDAAGCLNVIIPGLGYIYLGNLLRAILTFIVGSFVIGILLTLIAVDGGICTLPLSIGVLLVLFLEARSAAKKYNEKMRRKMR